MIDFHVHSKHSVDSHAEPMDIVRAAMGAGLKAICFTTHIDLNPNREGLDYFMRVDGVLERLSDEAVRRYREEITELKMRFSDEIEIRSGFEISYLRHYHERVREFIDKFPADFVLGAVHCLDNLAVTSSAEVMGYFRATEVSDAVRAYCEAEIGLAKSGLFSTIAHIDGIKKYGRVAYGEAIDRELETRLPPVFDILAEENIGIEINTSAMHKGHPDFYPSRKILLQARGAGVKVNSIGSDAHRACDVGYKINAVLELIREVGIEIGEPLKSFIDD